MQLAAPRLPLCRSGLHAFFRTKGVVLVNGTDDFQRGLGGPPSWNRGRLRAAPAPPAAWFPGKLELESKALPGGHEVGMLGEEVSVCQGMGSRWETRELVMRSFSLKCFMKNPLRWKRGRLHRLYMD